MEELLVKEEQKPDLSIEIYKGASMLKITEDEQKELLAPFDETEVEIRVDGIVYLPQVFFRKRLNNAFGIGQWALIPKSNTKDPERQKLYLEGVLIVRGNYIATSVGEAEYHTDNPMQSWASVYESAKSDCITRCCKDMSIAADLWNPDFVRKWISKYALKVWRNQTGKKRDGGAGSFQWRKKTSDPFWDEAGAEQPKQETTTATPAKRYERHPSAEKVVAPEPPPHVSGKIEPNVAALPQLNEKQFVTALRRISEGETDLFPKLRQSYQIGVAWYNQLNDAHEFSLKVSRDTGYKPAEVLDLPIEEAIPFEPPVYPAETEAPKKRTYKKATKK